MVIIIILLLVTLAGAFLRFMLFMCGATCTLMGAAGLVTTIVLWVNPKTIGKEDLPMYLMVSIFTLLLGIFLLWLFFHFKKKRNEESNDEEVETKTDIPESKKTKEKTKLVWRFPKLNLRKTKQYSKKGKQKYKTAEYNNQVPQYEVHFSREFEDFLKTKFGDA